jgi:hypothetical protein
VIATARSYGLTTARYGPSQLAGPAASAAVALLMLLIAWRSGETGIAVADSLRPRLLWLIAIAGALGLAADTIRVYRSPCELPTSDGLRRTAKWMGYRRRLRAKIPARATIVAPPEQQRALADASVMGVAEHVLDMLPIVSEDDRKAWSDAGEVPHIVRVRYPMRPAYGRQPLFVTIVGLIVLIGSIVARHLLGRVADGELLDWLFEQFPEQDDLIETIARVLSYAVLVPAAWSIWAIVAGVVDTVSVTERVGVVVRARRPAELSRHGRGLRLMSDRHRYTTFLAVDDGTRRSVTAWMADERTSAPQGAQARVRATPLLGHVRKSEPVGTATRPRRPLPH